MTQTAKKHRFAAPLFAGALFLVGGAIAAGSSLAAERGAAPAGHAGKVARGKYLTTIAGCNDCHTPEQISAGTKAYLAHQQAQAKASAAR